jgi:hypothetical protein
MDSFIDGKNVNYSTVLGAFSLPDSDTSALISYDVLQQPGISSTEQFQYSKSKCFGRLLILFNAVCYGTTLCCIHILSFSFLLYPSVSCFIRFLVASSCFFPQSIIVWNVLTRINLEQRNKIVWFAVEIGAYQFLGYLGQYQSIFSAREKTSNVAVISSLSIVVVSFLDFFFSPTTTDSTMSDVTGVESIGENNDNRLITLFVKVVSILLSVAGILFIELSTFLDHHLQHSSSWHIIWSFLQPIFFGLAIWKMERYIYICQNDSLVIQAFCFIILCTITVISFLWLSFDLMYPTIQNHFSAFSFSSNVSAVLYPSITEQFFNVMTN